MKRLYGTLLKLAMLILTISICGGMKASAAESAPLQIEFQTVADEWNDDSSWQNTEQNLRVIAKKAVELKKGTVYIDLCIPTDNLVDGQYDIELWAILNDVTVYSQEKYNIRNGKPVYGDFVKEDGYYIFTMQVAYELSAADKVKPQALIKIHTSNTKQPGTICFRNLYIQEGNTKYPIDFNESAGIKLIQFATSQEQPYKVSQHGNYFTIENKKEELVPGETITLKAVSAVGEAMQLSFTSSNPKVGKIDSKTGTLTALSKGNTTITVYDKISDYTCVWKVSVVEPYIRSVQEKTNFLVGDTFLFKAEGIGLEGCKFVWSSSNKKVATIGKTGGKFTANQEGTTTITLTDTTSKKKDSFTVTVYDLSREKAKKYITVKGNGHISKAAEQKVLEHLSTVYGDVFRYFNDGIPKKVVCNFVEDIPANSILGMDYCPAYTMTQTSEITVSAKYLNDNPGDIDLLTHELIHCAQQYNNLPGELVWLMEGITDYGRYLFGINNEAVNWQLPKLHTHHYYTDSYTVTAAFLKFVADTRNENIIQLVNEQLKTGEYDGSIWFEEADYTLNGLWSMYLAANRDVMPLQIGDKVPDFSVETADGKTVSLKDYRGEFVLVDFWGTWCGPCIAEFPNMQRLYEAYGDKLNLLAISNDGNKEGAIQFMKDNKYTFPIGLEGPDNPVCGDVFRISGWPAKFLINPEGVIVLTSGLGEGNEGYQRYIDELKKCMKAN